MTGVDAQQKVKPGHLRRMAYVYIRQSSQRQVLQHTESGLRQRQFHEAAMGLGWSAEQIVVVDDDQGVSATKPSAQRDGFERLLGDVALGRAGIVIGLEVARMARQNSQWYRLMEVCALSDTLMMDQDGIYDLRAFNDRLVLGLKGTISEAESYTLRMRLLGAFFNKGKRGELKLSLPVGLAYDPAGRVVLDPDQQVQEALRLFFRTFRRVGSARATVRAFNGEGLQFPKRVKGGPCRGEVAWGRLCYIRALQVLHNPRYAGAYAFGRTQIRYDGTGKMHVDALPMEQWQALMRDAHPGYISWEEYEENQRRLEANAAAAAGKGEQSAPREGPALLQGLALCGRCGRRMSVRYHTRYGERVPDYVCQTDALGGGVPVCQRVPGAYLDVAVGELLLEAVSPAALQVALAVEQEVVARIAEIDRQRCRQVESARYEAELAERRYRCVDPSNRLVAATLEAEWNDKLRALAQAQEEVERQRRRDGVVLDKQQRGEVLCLAADLPKVWRDPQTPDRERKRMARLILEDVTLTAGEQITARIRFKGGACRTVVVARPKGAAAQQRTDPEIVAEIDRLLGEHTDGEVASLLNGRGMRTGMGQPFDQEAVAHIRRRYGLKDRFTRLRASGMMTQAEVAAALGISPRTVPAWRRRGLLRAHEYNGQHACLYEPPAGRPDGGFPSSVVTPTTVDPSTKGAV